MSTVASELKAELAVIAARLPDVAAEMYDEGYQAGIESVAADHDAAIGGMETAIADLVQPVFDNHGPERDRRTDWLRCTEEPWFSLAGIFRADA